MFRFCPRGYRPVTDPMVSQRRRGRRRRIFSRNRHFAPSLRPRPAPRPLPCRPPPRRFPRGWPRGWRSAGAVSALSGTSSSRAATSSRYRAFKPADSGPSQYLDWRSPIMLLISAIPVSMALAVSGGASVPASWASRICRIAYPQASGSRYVVDIGAAAGQGNKLIERQPPSK